MSNNSSIVDPDNSLDYILLFRLIVWGYVGMVLSLFGIVGNIITILVLISPSMRTTSTNIYLTALSCSNILFLLIFIPSYSMRYLIGYRLYITNQPPFAFEILLTRLPTTPIYNTILLSIIYLTIAVSMDRLILVKFPLKAKQILTPRTTWIAILSIYLFSILYCIPYWLEQEYKPEHKQCRLTHIGRKIHKYTRIYIYIPVVYLIPFITLTCINITIIVNLIATKRRKKTLGAKTNKKKQADYHITLMLVAVIIVFVLCQIPLLVLNAWHAIDPHGSSQSIVFHSLNSIGILLIVFNTSTNFLLYCFFGQKFRKTLVRFTLHLFLNSNKQINLQTRISKLAENEARALQPIQVSDHVKVEPNVSIRKSNQSNEIMHQVLSNTSAQNSTLNTSIIQEESSPLLTKSEQISTINEDLSFKSGQKLNLYKCANGKQLLILQI
ncbi:hypothetical protein I4U23_018525 [Adineta vaga]|nr:hypothetical protein I4U23_018525 [Adineta vaga]